MEFVTEPCRKIPIVGAFEVIVCGGGPAGVCKAIASARSGMKTVLIERYGFLGGMATAGLVGPMQTFHAGDEQIINGIPQEIVNRLVNEGVEMFLHSFISNVVVNDNKIEACIIESKSGRKAIKGEIFIDATGD